MDYKTFQNSNFPEHLETVSLLQSWTKFMKQCQKTKQNWTGQENFEIFFRVIFDH